ncbi:MAG TPA: hypothetical protein IAD42_09320 [Candidatus Scatomorpha pullistercoris]|uniref:DUF2975 domain-containing protein n=2 Tax=Candidatus Scatomorpha pullistercoris TaxID=2840929 RepID=A0A9D1G6C4_9FIRM|nr:hypothetical protein [Candidatus Scatomorpha pullistercoris]
MNGDRKTVLSPARCLILCAAAALAGCAVYLFSVSQAESALGRLWFPFAQIQAVTAGADGRTPQSVCLVLAALPVFGFLAQLLRQRFRPEDLLLLLCAVLVYMVMDSPLNEEGLFASSAVQPSAVWTALLVWAGLRILRACCAAEGAPLVRWCGWGVCAAALYFAYSAGANVGATVLVLRYGQMGAAALSKSALMLVSSGLGVAACMYTLGALRRYDIDGELSEAVMAAVGRLSRFCAAALAAMLLLAAAVELVNVLARPAGLSLSSVSFPVSALIYCFAVLLGARLVAAHKRLKDDNDLFV